MLECPVRAEHEAEQPKTEHRPHVGRVIGDKVHNAITGHDYKEPLLVTYDQYTTNPLQMQKQAGNCARLIQDWFEENEYEIVETEYRVEAVVDGRFEATGSIDILARHQNGDMALIDIKTGAYEPAKSWTQLAVYAVLLEARGTYEIKTVIVLWAQRHELTSFFGLYVDKKPVSELVKYGRKILHHLTKTLDMPVEKPSKQTCGHCEVKDCIARYKPEREAGYDSPI